MYVIKSSTENSDHDNRKKNFQKTAFFLQIESFLSGVWWEDLSIRILDRKTKRKIVKFYNNCSIFLLIFNFLILLKKALKISGIKQSFRSLNESLYAYYEPARLLYSLKFEIKNWNNLKHTD